MVLSRSRVTLASLLLRLFVVALGVSAIAIRNQVLRPDDVLPYAAFLAIGSILLLVTARWRHPALTYSAILFDVAAGSGIVFFTMDYDLPLWTIYLLPIAIAAPAGRVASLFATGSSIASYLLVSRIVRGVVSLDELWAVGTLATAAAAIALSSARLRADRLDRRAWQELAVAARALPATGTLEEVTSAVADRARHLLRAEGVTLWWCECGAHLRTAAHEGQGLKAPVPCDELAPQLLRRLEHVPLPLAELGPGFTGWVGNAIALRSAAQTIAVLLVTWDRPLHARHLRLSQLRAFAPYAAAALVGARERAALREDVRWAGVLSQVAAALAGTLEIAQARRIVVAAARAGLSATAALVRLPSGTVLEGDAEVAGALIRVAADDNEGATSPGTVPIVAKVGGDLALLAWRPERRLRDLDTRRLQQLATLAVEAFKRCTQYTSLLEEARRMRAAIDGAPAPISVWNTDGVMLFANNEYRQLDLSNRPPEAMSPSGERELELTIGEGVHTFVARTGRTSDGKQIVEVYSDITREREALRAKDRLISVVGHELRSPLTTIYGYNQMMSRQLAVVQRQVTQLNHLIGDFADAARTEGGKLPFRGEPVDVKELAQAAAERFRGAYEKHFLRLDLSDVPPVTGDPERLAQVLDNLLGNAAKYSPGEGQISLAVGAGDGELTIAVSDHGIGIAPEYLPHVFDRFYRVPNPETNREKGLGLGLSIVRDLVTAHGGRVWAESEGQGKGATFRVSLPLHHPTKLTGATSEPNGPPQPCPSVSLAL